MLADRIGSPLVYLSILSVFIPFLVHNVYLGPVLAGALSDPLAPSFGDELMRYTLLTVCTLILPWSAWHCRRASKTIEQDVAAWLDPGATNRLMI